MTRKAFGLQNLDVIGADSLLFISDNAGDHPNDRAHAGRDNGLNTAHPQTDAADFGLVTAGAAPSQPVVPLGPPADVGNPAGFDVNGDTVLLDAHFANAKGGKKGPPPPPDPTPDPTTFTWTTGADNGVPDSDEYNVQIVFHGTWSDVMIDIFMSSANYIAKLITGDVPDIVGSDGALIDDIRIDATLAQIDGSGGILGQAGPTYARTGSYLPTEAVMEFDIADADYYASLGLFDDIVLHEMLHSIGFGTVWSYLGLVDQYGRGRFVNDLRFNGDNAAEAYTNDDALAFVYAADGNHNRGVPVETDGGSGTAGGHWDEALFQNELMTGYIDNPNYLSVVTVAALEDMGYDTIYETGIQTSDMPAYEGALLIG